MADNYTSEGLISFIYQNVTVDAPHNWSEVTAEFTITRKNGHTNSKSSYRARINSDSEWVKFQPNNIFGPHNAAHELIKLQAQKGEAYEVVIITIKPNGTASYEFK